MEQEGVVSHIENRALTGDEISLLAGLITEEPDHYTVLGVNRDASSEDIHSAYRLAVEYFHPLKSRELTESDSVMHWKLSSAFLRIEEAFTVLSRPSRREIYDDNLSGIACRTLLQSKPVSADTPRAVPAEPAALQKPKDGSGKELRRVPREPLVLPLRVSFDRQWQELTETTDVSPLGVRFKLSRPLEPGSELRLEMPMPRNLRTHSFDADLYVCSAFVIYAANAESGRQVVAEFI